MLRWINRRHLAGVALLTSVCTWGSRATAAECENGTFTSTYALIEKAIFENRGCTSSVCHGAAASGGLDMRPPNGYANLVDVDAVTVEGWKRILAGQSNKSLFWVNLAAKTSPMEWHAPLRAMPLDPIPALSVNEIEALRLWIEKGAPREGVVPDTANLLDACLPPPEPLAVKPLDPPPPGKGIQLLMPPWTLDANSEHEVCFATYYDVTEQVPPELRQADGTFLWNLHQTRQDPLSHHMVPVIYDGTAPADSPLWPAWRCVGGPKNQESCNPLETTFCGSGGQCTTELGASIGCLGYGPGDGGIGFTSPGISVTQQTAEEFQLPPGVYRSLPMRGIILWSSHAFNLTNKAGSLRAWLNFEFASLGEDKYPAEQIFDADEIFKMEVPPYKTQEVCSFFELPAGSRLFELSSHMHKRGKRWRTFRGRFACDGGPNSGQACSPVGYDFASPDICAGAPCAATKKIPAGDCDLNGRVSSGELLASIDIALGAEAVDDCRDGDVDEDSHISVDELVNGVNAAMNGVPAREPRDGRESLMYTSLNYNDPAVLPVEPPLTAPGPSSQLDDRTLTFCALYDNGFLRPEEVKLKSTSPPPPFAFPGIGGPCETPTHCSAGKVGSACSGRLPATRNTSCDTTAGARDGVCDACPLLGGVTTEDEMFILFGYYYTP